MCVTIQNFVKIRQTVCEITQFLPRDSYAKRGIYRRRVFVCLSVCVCVCVCMTHSGTVSKRLNVRSYK